MNPNKLGLTETFGHHNSKCKAFYEEFKANGYGNFPPVIVYNDGYTYYVMDGNHRVTSARWANLSWIPVEYCTVADLPNFGFTEQSIEMCNPK